MAELEEEVEVDATQIISKKMMKLRTFDGNMFLCHMDVFESEQPYVIIIVIETPHGHSLRLDVVKEDLARELRLWLEGKQIQSPTIMLPRQSKVADAILHFVKYGNTPNFSDLITWILSRSELTWGEDPQIHFGGLKNSEVVDTIHHERDLYEIESDLKNTFSRTANAAVKGSAVFHPSGKHEGEDRFPRGLGHDFGGGRSAAARATQRHQRAHLRGSDEEEEAQQESKRSASNPRHSRSKSANAAKAISRKDLSEQDMGTYEVTRRLIGEKSEAIDMLMKSKVKGRDGAKKVLGTNSWTADQARLCAEIERARKDIEEAMEDRRMTLETARTRQKQSADRYRKIRETIDKKKTTDNWTNVAHAELTTLQKVYADILDDISRQKNRIVRASRNIAWTIAPSAFKNRRGTTMPGPLLGPGPLPAEATTRMKDPRIESSSKRFYWDASGRRHEREDSGDTTDESLVSQAMECIRRAAANASAYKLDLKAVFDQFDTSSDGFISKQEMAEAFMHLGVHLDLEMAEVLFRHFDPDGSGAIHYGEFVWAFFNRRALVRQWKKATHGLTHEQILSKFHQCDINGDGRLDHKEFRNMLKCLDIVTSDDEQDTLVGRFDLDGDGDVDLKEFFNFMEAEMATLGGPHTTREGRADVGGFGGRSSQGESKGEDGLNRRPQKASSSSPGGPRSRSRPQSSSAATRRSFEDRVESVDKSLRYEDHEEVIHNNRSSRRFSDFSDTQPPPPAYEDNSALDQNSVHSLPTNLSRTNYTPGNDTMRRSVSSPDATTTTTDLDALWASRMLRRQATVENKLGGQYF